jgi:hypothetical protein
MYQNYKIFTTHLGQRLYFRDCLFHSQSEGRNGGLVYIIELSFHCVRLSDRMITCILLLWPRTARVLLLAVYHHHLDDCTDDDDDYDDDPLM